MSHRRLLAVALTLGACTSASVQSTPSTATATAPLSDECAVYAAAFTHAVGDTTRPIVIYDSSSLGVPRFAFRAFTGLRPPTPDTGFVITDSLLTVQRDDNQARIPLPACISTFRKTTRLQFDSLRAHFVSGGGGWDAFNAAYPDARGLFMVSKVTWLAPDSTQALVYVAHASGPLAGGGQVLYLRKTDGRWRVRTVRRVWAS